MRNPADHHKVSKRRFPRVTLTLFVLALLLAFVPGSALAQTYYFSLPSEKVNVYWNEDGTSSVEYVFVFNNDPSADNIEYVDVGIPNENYDFTTITAEVNGQPAAGIETSPYVTPGIAVNLGSNAIRPGESGEVHVYIGKVRQVLYPDSSDDTYASAVFQNTYFDSSLVYGTTDLQVTFHLPPGVKPEEPRWHEAPSGFTQEPITGFDDQGRITYTWQNAAAEPDSGYTFGASFPAQYVPKDSIVRPNPFAGISRLIGSLMEFLPILICGGLFILFPLIGVWTESRRKLKYLPPKIAIEGHGIKRGLTSIEAAILMEQPLDKVLTMILFSVIKKGAAEVVERDPIKLKITEPLPEGLHEYEKDFLEAFRIDVKADQRKSLQKMMVGLVKSLENKMKGFSRRETIVYYQDIMRRAWAQVEAADTPEVKSAKFDEVMEWTMLDKNYDDRTKDVFRTGPVFVPMWWPRYDPTFGRGGGMPAPTTSGGGKVSLPSPSRSSPMPTLPGSAFAGSIVGGVQNFSKNVVGSITDFTSGVTGATNPPPKTTSSTWKGGGGGGGGGSSCACACACACAGCACACAGGGR